MSCEKGPKITVVIRKFHKYFAFTNTFLSQKFTLQYTTGTTFSLCVNENELNIIALLFIGSGFSKILFQIECRLFY